MKMARAINTNLGRTIARPSACIVPEVKVKVIPGTGVHVNATDYVL